MGILLVGVTSAGVCTDIELLADPEHLALLELVLP
jgi:hypothetical protein